MSAMILQLPINHVDVDREEMEYVDGGTTYSGATGWKVASLFTTLGASVAYSVSAAITMLMPFGPVGWFAAATLVPGAAIFGQLASAGKSALWYMAIYGRFTITTNNNPFNLFNVTY